MTELGAAVVEFLADHPRSTVEDVARALRSRTALVRDVLVDEDLFSSSLRLAWPSDRCRVYSLPVRARDGSGRVAADLRGALAALGANTQAPSQCDRILSLLADGRTWSSYELHKRVFCVLHSRITELRRRLHPLGFDIEHTGGGAGTDVHWYRLICTSSATSEETAAKDDGELQPAVSSAAVSSGAPAADDDAPESESACSAPVGAPELQLQIGEAA